MVSYIGIDSATFYHEGRTTFKAPFGVAVETNNYDKFNEKYVKIVHGLKGKYHVDTERICLKGHFLFNKISNNAYGFLNEFVESILPSLKMIYVAHAIISVTKIPEIRYMRGKSMPAMAFVNALCSSFNHVIAWNLLNDFSDRADSHFFIDHFTGTATKAWEEIENLNNIFILPAGEYCNPLISTADMIGKYIGDTLYRNNSKLGFEGISNVFTNKPVREITKNMDPDQVSLVLDSKETLFYQTNNSPFPMITPSSSRKIQVDSKLKHPVVFILTSQILKKESEMLESTPMFDLLVNDAYNNHGCLRSINLDEITNEVRYMKKGDKIITMGEDAFKKANYLVKDLTGLNIEIISSRDFLEQ